MEDESDGFAEGFVELVGVEDDVVHGGPVVAFERDVEDFLQAHAVDEG